MLKAIQLRPTTESDLDFVLSAERIQENFVFIVPGTREQHCTALTNPNMAHCIIETLDDPRSVGFLIVCGLEDPSRCLEFRKIVITEKGKGFGREALELLKDMAFITLDMHRLWLDVKEQNQRARHLYSSVGFVEEGLLRECLWNGKTFESLILMSMLSREYYDSRK
ncbi:MAG: GNAT family N-acetyltransferase [Anaerolineae bacterium]|nr:GNAT family N-acetyltransferase [Gloeobacterales cyanobacterium ES-bin-313]